MSIHTYRRQGRFWFRFAVPARLAHLYGDEIRFTLSTFNRTVAQELATACWHRCRQLLQADPSSLGIHNRRDAINFVRQAMNEYLPIVALTGDPSPDAVRHALRYLVAFNIEIGVQPPSDHIALVHRWIVHERFPSGAWETFSRRKFTYATLDSKQLNRIISSSDECFKAEYLYTHENNQRLMLWYDEFTVYLHQLLTPKNIDQTIADRLKQAAQTVSAPRPSLPSPVKTSPLLSAEILAYCEKMSSPDASDKHSADWSPKTLLDARAHLATFREIIGDKACLEICASDYDRFERVIKVLPSNRKKGKKAGKTIDQLVEMQKQSPTSAMSGRTIDKYYTTIMAFLRWAKKRNPDMVLTLEPRKSPKGKKKGPARDPFTPDQLKLIFESDEAIEYIRNRGKVYCVYLPLMGLFGGGRLSEYCQLQLSDIGFTDDGIMYIYINEDADLSSIKNDSSERRIPVHNTLRHELGFEKFVAHRKSLPRSITDGRLFGDELLWSKHHAYMRNASYFFGKLLDHVGLTSRRLVYHSFRNTMIDHLRRADVKQWLADRYVGHGPDKDDSEGDKSYRSEATLNDLLAVTKVIDFDIDWTRYAQLCHQTYK